MAVVKEQRNLEGGKLDAFVRASSGSSPAGDHFKSTIPLWERTGSSAPAFVKSSPSPWGQSGEVGAGPRPAVNLNSTKEQLFAPALEGSADTSSLAFEPWSVNASGSIAPTQVRVITAGMLGEMKRANLLGRSGVGGRPSAGPVLSAA